MSKIFLIAGMGADTRIYNNIELPAEYDVIPVDWIEPHETDTLEIYAQKLIYQYDIRPNDIVIGNSLGGMLAIEIAKKISLKKTILISSIKTIDEAPGYYKIFQALPVYKIIPNKLLTSTGFMIKPIFGDMSDADLWLFKDMLRNTSPTFLKWAMGAVLKWDNEIIPPNVHHIHGDADLIFPVKKIKDFTLIKGGTHIMIFNRAKEINKWLKPILKK
jgi:pimeloyl-ACP methyl ester carboxylesterase